MNELATYSIIVLCSVLISSIAQIILKKSAQKKYANKIKEYINPLVITGYSMYFFTFLISTFCLRVIPLSMMPILDASGYVFVAILSYVFLKEKYDKKQMFGMFLIISGVLIYSFDIF